MLLSPCPIKDCAGKILSMTYLGLDPLKRHMAVIVCSRGHTVPIAFEGPHAIPKSPVFPPPKGHWWKGTDGGVALSCPGCGNIAGVNLPVHTITPDGAVTPSWVCPSSCGFHTFIMLLEWTPGLIIPI